MSIMLVEDANYTLLRIFRKPRHLFNRVSDITESSRREHSTCFSLGEDTSQTVPNSVFKYQQSKMTVGVPAMLMNKNDAIQTQARF